MREIKIKELLKNEEDVLFNGKEWTVYRYGAQLGQLEFIGTNGNKEPTFWLWEKEIEIADSFISPETFIDLSDRIDHVAHKLQKHLKSDEEQHRIPKSCQENHHIFDGTCPVCKKPTGLCGHDEVGCYNCCKSLLDCMSKDTFVTNNELPVKEKLPLKLRIGGVYRNTEGDIDTITHHDSVLSWPYGGKLGRNYRPNGLNRHLNYSLIEEVQPEQEALKFDIKKPAYGETKDGKAILNYTGTHAGSFADKFIPKPFGNPFECIRCQTKENQDKIFTAQFGLHTWNFCKDCSNEVWHFVVGYKPDGWYRLRNPFKVGDKFRPYGAAENHPYFHRGHEQFAVGAIEGDYIDTHLGRRFHYKQCEFCEEQK